ncbi:hypothetical protein HUG17_6006 [Dermatophagoides farinae]|uniref:Corticotropin-releasing factor binding protein N-terminal domain-containing protein n=1 Tax=Dermatophagoides farinae TaxID=6954 RepID=A0A9D4SIE9_DERFA|nr:hypothetical protein HUG17_6006 [Dermatophagoides farinae]
MNDVSIVSLSLLLLLSISISSIFATDVVYKKTVKVPKFGWIQHVKPESEIYIKKPGRYSLYMNDEKLLKTLGRIYFYTPISNASIGIYIDVRNGSCIAGEDFINFHDGWEFPNGRRFPSPGQHVKRFEMQICEDNQVPELNPFFFSSQNFAMLTYRIPVIKNGFTFTFILRDIDKPCNVMFYEEPYNIYGTGGRAPFIRDKYVLKNYRREINCSAYIFQQRRHKYSPYIRLVRTKIGPKIKRNDSEIIHNYHPESCETLKAKDYVEIGGDSKFELESHEFEVSFDFCPEHGYHLISDTPNDIMINCRIITIRLVSSGIYANKIQFKFLPPRMRYVCDWQYNLDSNYDNFVKRKDYSHLYC